VQVHEGLRHQTDHRAAEEVKRFTVKSGYKIDVRHHESRQVGVLNEDFCFSLADEIDYLDMRVYINVEGVGGIWVMSLFDWEQLAEPRVISDKKFLEGLYDGRLPDLSLHP
jgi:hypothetical protein